MFQSLLDFLTASAWTYPLLLGIAAGDAVFPVLPSETALIVCGIQAGRGQLSLGWIIVFAALGAFAGDNASYCIGRFLRGHGLARLMRRGRVQKRVGRARRFLDERGSYVLVIARFVPGGRTATTFTAGVSQLPWLRGFAPFVLIAAVAWAVYGALLGYLGGRAFRDHPLYAVALALAIALLIGGGAELYRRLRGEHG